MTKPNLFHARALRLINSDLTQALYASTECRWHMRFRFLNEQKELTAVQASQPYQRRLRERHGKIESDMNREEKERYLREMIRFKQLTFPSAPNGAQVDQSAMDFFSMLPKSLFKYRAFDEHSQEMIDQSYLFLCPAEKLDDPFECLLDLDVSTWYDENRETISATCFQLILDTVLQFFPADQRNQVRGILLSCTNADYTLNRRKALDICYEQQERIPGLNIPMLINLIGNIPDQIQSPEMQNRLAGLIEVSSEARKLVGICSLTENPKSQVMWAMYGDDYKGYCIEYDFEHSVEAAVDTYPVVYEDGRSNNVVAAVLQMAMNGIAARLSNDAIATDQTQFLRTMLTKNAEWSFQEEWRVIDQAGAKVKAPPIKAIYVGHKAESENLVMILSLAKEHGFKVFKTKVNSKTLGLDFEEVR